MTKAKEGAAEAAAQKTVVEEKKKELKIYIGPTIPGVATSNTVYNNGLNKELEDAIKEQPVIGSLVVPVARLAEAKKELGTKNTALEICYRKVESHIGQKGE